jgi:hypothetical protein
VGARAHIRAQVNANSASVGATNGQVTVGGRTVAAENIGYADSIRLLGRQYHYGGQQALSFGRGQFQAAQQAGIRNYAGTVRTDVTNAFRDGGAVRNGWQQTQANFNAFRQNLHQQGTLNSSRAVQGYQARLTRLEAELASAAPAQQAAIQAQIDATRIGLQRAQANALAGPQGQLPGAPRFHFDRNAARTGAIHARTATEMFNTQFPGALPAVGANVFANGGVPRNPFYYA